ncbi:hypothetical protein Aduo_014254 [Ancylostoma duodenale]
MTSTSTLLLLVSLLQHRTVTAVKCFVGVNSARKVTVHDPYCSFTITYKNDHCDSKPEVVLRDHGSPISDLSAFGVESLCYHSETSITCLCFGHLCNDEFNQKEILALELLKPSHDPRLRRIVVCYLLNNHAHAVFEKKSTTVTQEASATTTQGQTRTPYQNDKHTNNRNENTRTAPNQGNEYKSETAIFLALVGTIAAVFVFALVVILVVIILASKKKKASKKPKKSKSKDKDKDKAPSSEEKSNEKSSERSLRLSQEAVRPISPPADYNNLTYGMPGYSDNINFSRHALPDRALGIREDQEGYVLRSDEEIRRMKREQARELRRMEEEFRSLSEMDDDERDEQDRRREDSD